MSGMNPRGDRDRRPRLRRKTVETFGDSAAETLLLRADAPVAGPVTARDTLDRLLEKKGA